MSKWEKAELLYEGKAKRVYSVSGEAQLAWLEFKDSLTAFNAQKKGSFADKGATNTQIAEIIFAHLKSCGIKTHWVETIDQNNIVVKKLDMIPLEVVVRNRVAGSLAKRFGMEEGGSLRAPLVEFYYKDDDLGDPFVSDEQIENLSLIKDVSVLPELKKQGLLVNETLRALFAKANIDLVDFKLEYGVDTNAELVLADEISPDSCRLWDMATGERMDKDRFRRDLGDVEENYKEILKRLKELALASD